MNRIDSKKVLMPKLQTAMAKPNKDETKDEKDRNDKYVFFPNILFSV